MAKRARRTLTTGNDFKTSFELINGNVFAGFVLDPADPSRRFTVELLIDGLVIDTAYCENYVREIAEQGLGDGCYGFVFTVSPSAVESAKVAEARIANLGFAVGSPLDLDPLKRERRKPSSTSDLRWLGGLRFSGWVEGMHQNSAKLKATVDGEVVMQVQALGWAQADDAINKDRPARAFDFQLPDRFADGCVRWLSVLKDTGEDLHGGPLPFVAFPDGLAAAISKLGNLESERLRGEMYDHLIPMSLPMSNYDQWQQRFPPPLAAIDDSSCAVVLVGKGSIETSLESLDNQTHARWTACSIEDESGPTGYDVETVRAFLEADAAESDFVVFALTGTIFEPHALQRIAQAFFEFNEATAVYGDINILAADTGKWPVAFPAFDYERLLEQGYCAHLFALRRNTADRLISSSPANLYRLFNALFDDDHVQAAANVIHVPGAIGTLPSFDLNAASSALRDATARHLQLRKIRSTLTPVPSLLLPAVRIQRKLPQGHTTIVIPTRNRFELLRDCLELIRPAVEKNDADIIIVDNDSTDPKTCEFLSELSGKKRAKIIRVEGPFNFSRLNNIAVRAAHTEFICLLNNDIKALDADWLQEMLGRMSEPDVGAVGALLLRPSGLVQHAGVVLGPSFAATHAFNDRMVGDCGYADLLRVAHECSAVTAACLVTRRSDYLSVGGMDEIRLPVSFNDVDYCLKLRQAAKRVVFTPHAKLIHLESASRGKDREPGPAARFGREIGILRARWGQLLVDDPYYNPVLSLDEVPFSALAWPPRNMQARAQPSVICKDLPPGF